MNNKGLISIIIPVYNAGNHLKTCLESIDNSSYPYYEIIVVDDSSTDNSAEIARKKGVNILSLPNNSGPKGPAFARNYGAQRAQGDIIMFVDSDVVVNPETIRMMVENFDNYNIDAVFGSYDDCPAHNNFISQYKNMFHHFVHQQSHVDSSSFWAGCGAVKRDVFIKVGGFDDNRYRKPSIEDIELGIRLKVMGYKILLDKNVQVKHLKKWSFWYLIKTDVINRAIPWIKLIIETKSIPRDLNLKYSHRISSVLVTLLVALMIFLFSGSYTFLFTTKWIYQYVIISLIAVGIGITFRELYLLLKQFNNTSILNIKKLLLTLLVGFLAVCSIFLLIDRLLFNFVPIPYLFYFIVAMLFFDIILLNSQVYNFFAKQKGIRFTLLVICMHFLYYLYSFLTFIICWPLFKLSIFYKTLNKSK